MFRTGWKFWLLVGFLSVLVLWGLFAWGYLIYWGMGTAGINRPVYWGFFIATFVFWVGISHAGTMISAVLRLLKADWRRPITRGAEAMTAFALMMAGLFPFIHLGRVWKFYWMLPYPNNRFMWPNFQSPLMWDMVAIFTYFIGSTLYLYLALIPDLAMARDHTGKWRQKLYRVLSPRLARHGGRMAQTPPCIKHLFRGNYPDLLICPLNRILGFCSYDSAPLAQHNIRPLLCGWRNLFRTGCIGLHPGHCSKGNAAAGIFAFRALRRIG
jgi:hypothetical protein